MEPDVQDEEVEIVMCDTLKKKNQGFKEVGKLVSTYHENEAQTPLKFFVKTHKKMKHHKNSRCSCLGVGVGVKTLSMSYGIAKPRMGLEVSPQWSLGAIPTVRGLGWGRE